MRSNYYYKLNDLVKNLRKQILELLAISVAKKKNLLPIFYDKWVALYIKLDELRLKLKYE